MRRLGTWLALLLASFLLVLTGCGGGGEAPQTTPPSPTATTAAPPAAPPSTAATGQAEGEEAAPLLAWADGTPEEGKAPLTVEFKADTEGGKPPLKYEWKFGDGSPASNDANPKHTYDKPGKYRADLSVSDSGGDSDTDYVEIEVQ
ncbi:MAG TPA: PKD domain-containing protein [Candidatus Binatia bacterium]|nr:PKD domain-containing protein [Candidatus Binatia bacterium]